MSRDMPTLSYYGDRKTERANAMRLDSPEGTLWFSYNTLVAFRLGGKSRVVHTNDWGPTTGKHLNAIDGGKVAERVGDEEFRKLWQAYSCEEVEVTP